MKHIPFEFAQNLSCSFSSVRARVMVQKNNSITQKAVTFILDGSFQFLQRATVNFGIYCCSTCHGCDKQDSSSIPKYGYHQLPIRQSLTGFPQ
ncbi:hypothetical protein TNCT_106471 [Trichonephila clavata]|uniref:Uncharacterized protein n=1 Tax=Trichonephila clavata TaxID=2740835 RepID=A0A8X6L9X9_TRICU|nr:hypothetical protein TNCT_106471 [Trichonephila clavata]